MRFSVCRGDDSGLGRCFYISAPESCFIFVSEFVIDALVHSTRLGHIGTFRSIWARKHLLSNFPQITKLATKASVQLYKNN